MVTNETASALAASLRSLTIDDAAEVLENAQVSDPLTPEDVFAFYNWMLDRVIGEEN